MLPLDWHGWFLHHAGWSRKGWTEASSPSICPRTSLRSRLFIVSRSSRTSGGNAAPVIQLNAARYIRPFNVRDLITFYLSIKYRAPSKERSFLIQNWGVRDVSGPYLNSLQGLICIDNAVLSSEIPSAISIVFSVSNRCPTASILTKISTQKEEIVQHIARNGSREFIIDPVFSTLEQSYKISVCLPDVKNAADLKIFSDILAVDEITIERHRL